MKRILALIGIICSMHLNAQTGIGTTTPNASAKLDVYSTNKGFLPPRVTLTSATDATTIASPAEGLLVYNLGSVGLQAGYYYWNGANWATIATATSAGNGVTAMDMKALYSKAYSTAVGDIAETNGFSFTVPVSGRYLFDFSSSGYANSATVTMTFKVRQGAVDLGSDAQTSANNTVHVEYNGKVEVNLQAGTTYNVIVTSTGIRNIADYDRVYYKMVAGNLPVTGQTVEYGIARYTGADGGAMANGTLVSFDATAAGNLVWSGNKFTLKANKTYELESSLAIYQTGGGVAGRFQIYDYTNSVALANGLFMSQNGGGTNNPNANSPMKAITTPATDIQVGVRLLDYYGPAGPGIVGSTSSAGSNSSPNASYFIVKQLGSSAIVNPWVLSGNDVYNTTGEVGIGTSSPQSTLDIRGSQAQNYTATSSTAYTVLATDNVIDLTLAGTQAVTNFTASTSNLNRVLTIVNNTSVATKTISSYLSNLGTTVTTIPANATLVIQSTGTVWKQINGIAASSNTVITTTNGNGTSGQLLSSNGNGTYTWITLNTLRVLNNPGGTYYTQSQLQALYDGVSGLVAPDTVPIEVVNAANARNNTQYKVYLGHNKWWYTNAQSGTTSSWSAFGGTGNKSDFSANIDANGLFTFK